MRGLFLKTWRETWWTTVAGALGLALAMGLLTYVLPRVQAGIRSVMDRLPLIRSLIQALLGTELGAELSAQMIQAVVWVHPVVLTLLWAHEVIVCTRLPAGEIDRGTIDILLGLPVSRRALYLVESIVWLASGACVLAAGFSGHWWMARELPAHLSTPPAVTARVLVNLYLLYVAVGSVTLLVSAMCDRRGWAMAIVLSLLLASFLLNFLAQFWEPAQRVAFLGMMHYYRPAAILQRGTLPWGDLMVLGALAGVAWTAGMELFARRNIATV